MCIGAGTGQVQALKKQALPTVARGLEAPTALSGPASRPRHPASGPRRTESPQCDPRLENLSCRDSSPPKGLVTNREFQGGIDFHPMELCCGQENSSTPLASCWPNVWLTLHFSMSSERNMNICYVFACFCVFFMFFLSLGDIGHGPLPFGADFFPSVKLQNSYTEWGRVSNETEAQYL